MNPSSRRLLERLLDQWQGNPGRSRVISLPITPKRAKEYLQAVLPTDKEALHAGLQEAEAAGCVRLVWHKGYDSHILQRIELSDPVSLSRYLGIPLARHKAEEARGVLTGMLSGREAWIQDWVESLLDRWCVNQKYCGLQPGDLTTTSLLVTALEAVAARRHLNLDMRTFSTRELGNSKAMERLVSRFVVVWKKYHPSDYCTKELLASLGLVKFPQPLYLRGAVFLQLSNKRLDCSGIEPFLGIPPQGIVGVSLVREPQYLLTIENYPSFYRYAAEVKDSGVVIFTGGVPAPALVDVLRWFDQVIPERVPFFHWGDIDEGGLKIVAFLSGALRRPVQPHLMTPELLKIHGQPPKTALRKQEVRRIAERYPALSELAQALLDLTPTRVLEQEAIDPVTPLLALV